MATYRIWHPGVNFPQSSVLGYAIREVPEDSTQTWPAVAPIIIDAGGHANEAADPSTAIWGFALQAGQNNATPGAVYTKAVPAIDGLTFFANFLTSAGATNNIATADLADNFDLHKSSVLPPSNTAVWHASDSSAAASITLVSFQTDQVLANTIVNNRQVANGDTDARVEFAVLASVRTFPA